VIQGIQQRGRGAIHPGCSTDENHYRQRRDCPTNNFTRAAATAPRHPPPLPSSALCDPLPKPYRICRVPLTLGTSRGWSLDDRGAGGSANQSVDQQR
jgi:hypothetical protein